jgi:hypothetical protein
MRSLLTAMLATLLSFATACATPAQRRTTSAVTIAAGATLLATGFILSRTEDDNDCPDSSDGSLCLDLINENAIGGVLLMMAGGAVTAGGLIGFAASRPPEEPPPAKPPAPVVLDPHAADCIEWRRELDAETDPARRGAVNAIRPAHCPRPGAAPEQRSAASP